MKLQNDSYDAHNLYFHARFAIFHFIYFYFISFALKNTKKNTLDMQTLVIRT